MWNIFELIWDPLFLLGVLTTTIYFYFTATFDFWAKKNVPFRKPTIFFGNFKQLLLFQKSQADGILEIYNWFKNEKFFGVFRVRTPNLILRNPDLIKHVFVKDFSCFCNRGIPINNAQDPLMGNLFNLEGKTWKGLRSKLTPAFSSSKIKAMFYLLVECATQLEKVIADVSHQNESTLDVRELTANFTIDVIGTCAFGIQINALIKSEESEFRKMARKLSKSSYKTTLWRMLRPALPNLFKILGVQMIDPEVTQFFKDVVSQMIKQRERLDIKRHDFVDLLIELKNDTFENDSENKQDLDDDQNSKDIELNDNIITAQAFVFFVAGYDTSANTIAFCLYELALNPEIQDNTRQDILNVMDKNDGKLTYDAVQEMKYLDMVVSETLRKYPLSPFLSRRCEYPYKIPDSDVELPAGMRVIIPIYGLHHDPNYYPDPDKFLPERFAEGNKRQRHPFVYLPFGAGPRNCIGQRFALLQTKVGIITFLRNHRLEICQKSTIPLNFSRRSFVTSSDKGIYLKIVSLS